MSTSLRKLRTMFVLRILLNGGLNQMILVVSSLVLLVFSVASSVASPIIQSCMPLLFQLYYDRYSFLLKCIVFTVNEQGNICIAGLNR